MIHPDTDDYNRSKEPADREICERLAREISDRLPEADNRIWHAHPVWFLDGNPVAGYSKLKHCVRLLFWSGRSFEEEGLKNEGSFQAAEALHRRRADRHRRPPPLARQGPRHPVGLQEYRPPQGPAGPAEVKGGESRLRRTW